MTKLCFLCDEEIDVKDSGEHIIPHSIGGLKKVEGFICKECNSKAGSGCDSEVAKKFNFLGVLLNIKRERSAMPDHLVNTLSGKSFYLTPAGWYKPQKPTHAEVKGEENVQIRMTDTNIESLTRRLKGVKRKYPNIDIDRAISQVVFQTDKMDDVISESLNFGGLELGRSAVKSALALCAFHGVELTHCECAKEFIKNNGFPCFGFYTGDDLVLNRPDNSVFHLVAVNGSKKDGLLLGYVEFYNVYRVVICLSERYIGEDFSISYAIDPTKADELQLTTCINITKEQLYEIYDYKYYNLQELESSLSKVMDIGLKIKEKQKWAELVYKMYIEACEVAGTAEGESATDEQKLFIAEYIAERMTKLILNISN